ncbi:MAG TPA: ABC transporter substrate-binding protein, partial [Beijerinckiaceae bacterium]|nr:ABC transporter substrate-binding protein [Beijerinckiaceae bacterium]
MTTKKLLLLTTFASIVAAGAAQAQTSVKLGVLNDRSGLYADISGEGSAIAARMAVEDFKAADKGIKVEVVAADHQNKPDVGSSIARQWYDTDGVDVILDVPTSSVALAVNQVTREKNKIFINSGAASSDLTGAQCSPNTVHWTYDTVALANGTGSAMVKKGGNTWYFITADYAFGHALERDTSAVVEKNGGKVVGKVRHPFPGTDFSSFLLQAQSSKAKIIGLANAGSDTINSIKQASEFGITRSGQNLAALLAFITDVHALGLATAQGLIMTEAVSMALGAKLGPHQAKLIVEEASKQAIASKRHLNSILAEDPRVTAHMTPGELARLFELMGYQGVAQTYIDRLIGSLGS